MDRKSNRLHFVRRVLFASLVSATAIALTTLIRCLFAGLPEGTAHIVLVASGVGGASGLVASLAFNAFRGLHRIGAILTGWIAAACYMICFSLVFKQAVPVDAIFWCLVTLYGIVGGLAIVWPIQRRSLDVAPSTDTK